jgi:hypothetical protein
MKRCREGRQFYGDCRKVAFAARKKLKVAKRQAAVSDATQALEPAMRAVDARLICEGLAPPVFSALTDNAECELEVSM